MNAEIKKILIKYGYFCLILLSLFLILTLGTVITRKSWTLGLKEQMQNTLDGVYPEESFVLGDAVQIEQPISVSAAAYKMNDGETEGGYAVIVRITGIAGPAAGLFIRRPGEAEFTYVGIISDDMFYNDSFPWYKVASRQISYWKERIPLMIGEVTE